MIGLEKDLVRLDYVERVNSNSIWTYIKNNDETSQLSLVVDNDRWKFSFPMKNHNINYTTYFTDYDKLMEYIEFVVYSDFIE